MDIVKRQAWSQLQRLYESAQELDLTALFAQDHDRFNRFSAKGAGLFLDYSKNHLTTEILEALVQLAKESGLPGAIEAMFNGERINFTEDRSAMHFALRQSTDTDLLVDGDNISEMVAATLERVASWSRKIRDGSWRGATGRPVRALVHIGIGGSGLGPQMALHALRHLQTTEIQCHFVANVDAAALDDLLSQLNPEETLFILVSKTFTTLETRVNAEAAKEWLRRSGVPEAGISRHFLAITANREKAHAFGIPEDQILPLWDWVGGRYSLWSAVGVTLAIVLGPTHFRHLLLGAEAMDRHFRETPLAENLPVLLALIGIWYTNFFAAETHAVIAYDHHLRFLPEFLQQLEMESNGKSVTREGTAVTADTAPIIWGGEGSNSQHSFHQLLFQGTRLVPVDFITSLTAPGADRVRRDWLYASCVSQSQALMLGRNFDDVYRELLAGGMDPDSALRLAPHKVVPGNKPSTTLVLEQVTPESLGALIALYEHKTFCQGTIWGINAFDQWGVELGKQLSQSIYRQISDAGSATTATTVEDASTRGLIALYNNVNGVGKSNRQ